MNVPQNINQELLQQYMEAGKALGKAEYNYNKEISKLTKMLNNSDYLYYIKEPYYQYAQYIAKWEKAKLENKLPTEQVEALSMQELYDCNKSRQIIALKCNEMINGLNYQKVKLKRTTMILFNNFTESFSYLTHHFQNDINSFNELKTIYNLEYGVIKENYDWNITEKESLKDNLLFVFLHLEQSLKLIIDKEEKKLSKDTLNKLKLIITQLQAELEEISQDNEIIDNRISEEDLFKEIQSYDIDGDWELENSNDDCHISWSSNNGDYGVEADEERLDEWRNNMNYLSPIVKKEGYLIDGEVIDNMAYITIKRK